MNERTLHAYATWTELVLAALTFAALLFITAPYGRHGRGGWGPEIPQRVGWFAMEFPACVGWAVLYAMGRHALDAAPLALFAMWQAHYIHRTFIFPFRLRSAGKTMPLSIVLTAVAFNSLNAYVNARWVSELGSYEASWLASPSFVVGALVFALGYGINHHADWVLLHLRKPGETGYRIPGGGLYRFVSCPNYLGEILEWTGWALATASLAGAAFALYTFANLAPRARDHHRWYRAKFADYPSERRALIPFVW